MSAAQPMRMDPESQYAGILERTMRAYTTAQAAAAGVADCLASKAAGCFDAVQHAEEELDRLDCEVDRSVAGAIVEVPPAQARELLSAMKMVVDLERIGDLFASVANCARAIAQRLPIDDIGDLVKMVTIIEKMLADACGALAVRNVDRAIAVLRADAEVDRLRNLVMIRHLERSLSDGVRDSVQVFFMAQALERAGDHVKNLAEEICHLATGHTVRHVLRNVNKDNEQMYLEYLKTRHGLKEPPLAPAPVRKAN